MCVPFFPLSPFASCLADSIDMDFIHVRKIAAVVAGIAVAKKLAFGGCGRDDRDEDAGVVIESVRVDDVVAASIDTTDDDSHVNDGGDDAAESEQRAIVRVNVEAIFGRVLARAAEEQNAADLHAANVQTKDAKRSIQDMAAAHLSSLAARDLHIASLEKELADEKRAHEQQLIKSSETSTLITNLENSIKTNKLLEEEKNKQILSLCDYVARLEHEVTAVRDELAQTVAAAQQDAVDKALALDAAARSSADEIQVLKAQAAEDKAQLDREAAKERATALAELKCTMEASAAKEKAAAVAQHEEAIARIAELDTKLAEMAAAAALNAREMNSRALAIAELKETLATAEVRLHDQMAIQAARLEHELALRHEDMEALRKSSLRQQSEQLEEHQLEINGMEKQLNEKDAEIATLKQQLCDTQGAARSSDDEIQVLKAQAAEEKTQLERAAAKERATVLANLKSTMEKNAAKKRTAALSEQKAALEKLFMSQKTAALNKQRVAMEDDFSGDKSVALAEQRKVLCAHFEEHKEVALMTLQSKMENDHSSALRSLERKLKSEFEAEKLQTIDALQADLKSAAEVTLKAQLEDLRHTLVQEHKKAMTLAVKEAKESERAAQMGEKNTALLQQREQLIHEGHITLQNELEHQRTSLTSSLESEHAVKLEEQRTTLSVAEEQRLALALEEQKCQLTKEFTSNQIKVTDHLREKLTREMEEKLEAQKRELTDAKQDAVQDIRHEMADAVEVANTRMTFIDSKKIRTDASTTTTYNDPVTTEEVLVHAPVKAVHDSVTAQNEATSQSFEKKQITDGPLQREEASVNEKINTEIVTEQNKETSAEPHTTKASHGSNTVSLRPLLERNSSPLSTSSRTPCPQREQHAARRHHAPYEKAPHQLRKKTQQPQSRGGQANKGGSPKNFTSKKLTGRHQSNPNSSAESARRRMRERHAQRSNGPRGGNSRIIVTARAARTTTSSCTTKTTDDEKHLKPRQKPYTKKMQRTVQS